MIFDSQNSQSEKAQPKTLASPTILSKTMSGASLASRISKTTKTAVKKAEKKKKKWQ